MEHTPIPAEIKAAYLDQEPETVKILGGGLINTTLLVQSRPAEKFILQQLHPIVEPTQTADYQVISQHLRDHGWEIPALVPTKDGALYSTAHDGKHWRAFEFVDSDSEAYPGTPMARYGTILGRLHQSLESLAFKPQFRIPDFHDTQKHADILTASLPEFRTDTAKQLGDIVLQEFAARDVEADTQAQIIHADPKLANILSRKGVPFTFIDWDTAMVASPWIDVGDMLRSVMSQNEKTLPEKQFFDGVFEIIEGYRKQTQPNIDPRDFATRSLQAASELVLELAIRYLGDHKDAEEGYFAWDNSKFASRHEHNTHRTQAGLRNLGRIKNLQLSKEFSHRVNAAQEA